jgi:glutaconate CoA-transferase subunit A
VQKEVALASRRTLVTVEEIVPELVPRAGGVILPGWALEAVALAPGGAHPSYAHGYYDRDNAFYHAWDAISRDRETFLAWMRTHVLQAEAAAG